MRKLLLCTLIVFLTRHSDGQESEKRNRVLGAGTGWELGFGDVHKDSLSASESVSEDVKLIVTTGATTEGGDGWRIKHNLGVGAEKQLLSGLSLLGFLDYARFDYSAEQTLGPPYRKDPSHILSIAAILKVYFPWYVSPFVQAGLGISYVNRGNLYYQYPSHVDGGGSVLTYLMNLMVGVQFYPFKECSLFVEAGFNGDWQKDRYPANSLGRFGIGVGI